MTTPQLLTEGITHIEDLDVTAFIDAVRRIGQMQASEKLDGSNLWFGLDDQGKLYTTRAGKRDGAEKFYSESDYPYFAAYNGFRGAHAALQLKERDIKIALQPGDVVEIEVLYGRQPNAVAYGLDGKNFIAFLRGIEPTPDSKVDQLTGILNNSEVIVKTAVIDTPDGINLDRKSMSQTFRFVGVQKINPELLKSVKLETELKKLEDYLEDASGIGGLTNFQLMTTSLGSIPKDERPTAKAAKDAIISAVKNQHKLTIKKALLDRFVAKVKPALGANDLSGDEDNGVEGVVLKDPTTGEQLKIVDKDGFTTINQFNFAVRNQIAGMVRTLDDTAPLESRGGITGQMKIRIADLLGNKDLAMGRSAKKIFADNMGDTPPATLKNVAKILNGSQDFQGVKRKVEAVVQATIDELGNMLVKFQKHKDSTDDTYSLKLKNGKTMGLSPEIVRRTLMTFAETRRNLEELKDKVNQAKSFDNLIAVLYGRAAKAVHQTDGDDGGLEESFNTASIEEATSMLLETRNFTDVRRYREEPDAQHMLQSYIATVLMATIIYKADDKRGAKLLKDKNNYRLTKYNDSMSPLNFWGYAVWNAEKPAIAKLMQPGVAAAVNRITKKIPPQWSKNLHLDLSYAGDLEIDWDDHKKTMSYLLQYSEGMAGIDRIKNMLSDVFNYESLSFDEKTKLLPKVYFFGTQYVPTSPLITRIRFIQNNLLGNGFDALDDVTPPSSVSTAPMQSIMKLLGEDGEIVQSSEPGYKTPAAPTGPNGMPATTANKSGVKRDPTAREAQVGDHKRQIVKRKRNPDIKFRKFERPTEKDET